MTSVVSSGGACISSGQIGQGQHWAGIVDQRRESCGGTAISQDEEGEVRSTVEPSFLYMALQYPKMKKVRFAQQVPTSL